MNRLKIACYKILNFVSKKFYLKHCQIFFLAESGRIGLYKLGKIKYNKGRIYERLKRQGRERESKASRGECEPRGESFLCYHFLKGRALAGVICIKCPARGI